MRQAGDLVAGRYRLCAELGHGGMGTVFEAINTWTERRVALKVLRTSEPVSEVALQRFVREGKLASRIEHDNVVQVLDMGQDDDGSVFIVQELVRGTSLRALLEDRLSVSESIAVTIALCDALQCAHEHGLIHRDVKPDNVLVALKADDRTVVPKLIDFGIARELDPTRDGPSLTESGIALGTAQYMAPEQARSANLVDERSDLWSLAAVLFELLTGRPPFVGSNFNTVVAQLLARPPPRADEVAPSVPRELADVLARALSESPEQRHPTARALREALIDSARALHIVPSLEPLADRVRPYARRGTAPAVAHPSTPSDGPRDAPVSRQEPARVTEELAPVATARRTTQHSRVAPRVGIVVAAAIVAAIATGATMARMQRAPSAASTQRAAPAAASAPPVSPAAPSPAAPATAATTPAAPATAAMTPAASAATTPTTSVRQPPRAPPRSIAQRPRATAAASPPTPASATAASASPPARPPAPNGAPMLPTE
jgi:serine/threonine protein kinase